MNDYIILKLGQMATYLGWTSVSDEVDLIVEDTLGILGLASEAASTNSVSLKAVTMYVTWQAVMYSISTDYTFSADKAKYNRTDMMEAAERFFISAKKEALPYIGVGQITVGEVTNSQDPYVEADLDEFALRNKV